MADVSFIPEALWLGADLRDARLRAGLGVRELAAKLGMRTHAPVSLWETGKKVPATGDVERYLDAVGVEGDERARLLEMAKQAKEPNWLAAGIPGVAEELGALMEIERRAKLVVDWPGPHAIPGLLQTGDVARSIMGDLPGADASVAMRLARKDILTRRDPVTLVALIGEGALRQPFADPEVMAAQLGHVLEMARRSNVTVQVVPDRTRWHDGKIGPFMLVEFERPRPIVHLEHYRASAFVWDEQDVAAYQDLARRLREEVALSPEASVELIAEVCEETEHEGNRTLA
jgi:transcriptional regulator with XRE-family HTH domain